jgi:hypothetical protein
MSGVSVFLHQQHYAAGDALTGDVVVTVAHPLQAHHVTLFLDGHEKVYWEGTTEQPTKPTTRKFSPIFSIFQSAQI